MSEDVRVGRFLADRAGDGEFAGEGQFTLNESGWRSRYESVVCSPEQAFILLMQCAEKWNCGRAEVTVGRGNLVLYLQTEEGSPICEHLRGGLEERLQTLYPQDHPLYQLAHGYNILSRSPRSRGFSFRFLHDELRVEWRFDKRSRFLPDLGASLLHLGYRTLFSRLLWRFDGRSIGPFRYPTEFVHNLFQCGECPAPLPVVVVSRDSPGRWGSEDEFECLDEKLTVGEEPVDWWVGTDPHTAAPAVVGTLREEPYGVHLFYYGSLTRSAYGTYLVPVKYGTLLEPIKLDADLGPAVLFFSVDDLKTDFSGLRLLETEEYHQRLTELKDFLEDCIRALLVVAPHYHPVQGRSEVTKESVARGLAVPIAISAGLVLGGAPFLLKSALVWKAIGGGSVFSALTSARYIPDPDSKARAHRKKNLGWLERFRSLIDAPEQPPPPEAAEPEP